MDRESTFSILGAFFQAFVFIAIFLGLYFAGRKREETVLRRWAQREGFEIIESKRGFFTGGFSWLTTSRGQRVFSVTVRDREGRERSGWLRCGSYTGGILFSDEVEVKWKKE